MFIRGIRGQKLFEQSLVTSSATECETGGLLLRECFPHSAAVPWPDLRALQRGESAAWDEAFAWLCPAAFGAAQAKLQPFLPGDVEDVAMQASI